MDIETAFAMRMQNVYTYERTWWLSRGGAHLDFLDRHPERRAVLMARLAEDLPVYSGHVYLDSSEEWNHIRKVVHQQILDDLVPTGDALPLPKVDGVDAVRRCVYFLIGLPGSGKTTALRPIVARHAGIGLERLASSDADEVRCRFPEYEGGLGSGVVQMETCDVTYGGRNVASPVQDAVLTASRVAVVDVIGDPEHLPRTIQALAAEGRRCFVLLTRCPTGVCEQRVMQRAVSTGRFVPLELIGAKQGIPDKALALARETGAVSGWAVIDTSEASPRLVSGDGAFQLQQETS